jgi:hypothetical protein
MIIYVILIILGLFAIITKYWKFRAVIFMDFFKIKNFGDFLAISFICVFFIFFAGLIFLNSLLNPHSGKHPPCEFRTSYNVAFSLLDKTIVMSKQLDGSNPNNCAGCNSNKQALANFFIKRLNVLDSSDTYFKQLQKNLSQDTLLNNPYFITTNGTLFVIEKAQGKCGEINTTDPDKANCVIIVDTNEQRKPNQFSTGNKTTKDYKIKDRLRLIILKDKIAPASNAENDVAEYILNN